MANPESGSTIMEYGKTASNLFQPGMTSVSLDLWDHAQEILEMERLGGLEGHCRQGAKPIGAGSNC